MAAHSDCRLGYESPDDAPPSRQCRQRDPCDCWDVRRSGRIWMNHAVRSMEHRLSVSSSPIYSSQSPGRVRIWASMLWPCASLISLMRASPDSYQTDSTLAPCRSRTTADGSGALGGYMRAGERPSLLSGRRGSRQQPGVSLRVARLELPAQHGVRHVIPLHLVASPGHVQPDDRVWVPDA